MAIIIPFEGARIRAGDDKFLCSSDNVKLELNNYISDASGQFWSSVKINDTHFKIRHDKSGKFLGWASEHEDPREISAYSLVLKAGVNDTEFLWRTDGRYIYSIMAESTFGKSLILNGLQLGELTYLSPVCISKYKYGDPIYPFNQREIEASTDGTNWIKYHIAYLDLNDTTNAPALAQINKFKDNGLEFYDFTNNNRILYYCVPLDYINYASEKLYLRKSARTPSICLYNGVKNDTSLYTVSAFNAETSVKLSFAPVDDCNDPTKSIPMYLPEKIEEKKKEDKWFNKKILFLLIIVIIILVVYENKKRKWIRSAYEPIDYTDIAK